jgi:hypothetical protein
MSAPASYRCQGCVYSRACPNCKAGMFSSGSTNLLGLIQFQKDFDNRRVLNANKGVLFSKEVDLFVHFIKNIPPK